MMKLPSVFICGMLVLPIPALAKSAHAARQAQEAKVRQAVEDIKKECGITTGQFAYDAGKISIVYDGMIEPQKLECASDRALLAGVAFDSYDNLAAYSGPRRFIVKGPPKRIDQVAAAAVVAHWTVTHRADANDGIGYLEIETPEKGSRRDVQGFLDQFRGDFLDLAIGLAPMTRAGYDLPTTAMAFRANARRMYQDLNMSWCETPLGFEREVMLKPDEEMVDQLERAVATAPAATHLAIAREDANYVLSKETHCWANYNDPEVTRRHADMIHQTVSVYTTSLRSLAPAVEASSFPHTPSNAVEFLYEARQLTEWTLPFCTYTTKGSNAAVFAASLKQVRAFEDRLQGTPYASQYLVAKEDASYSRSQVTAECDEPGREPLAKLSSEMLGYAKKRIGQLEKLMLH